MTYKKNKHGDRILLKERINRMVGVIYYVDGQGNVCAVGLTKEGRKAVKEMTADTNEITQLKGDSK